jgi:hypothetical protein
MNYKKELDKIIDMTPKENESTELWVSNNIFNNIGELLENGIYRGYTVHTTKLTKNKTIYKGGSMFHR